jgi:hypothetical protein
VLAGHADTPTGRSTFEDFRRGVAGGHDQGLLKTILSQFGSVALPDGSVVLNYNADRVGRVVWKLVRGVYHRDVGGVLADDAPKRLILIDPRENKDAASKYPYFPFVRDTAPLGRHGAVFDYKWLGIHLGDGKRGHIIALLLWDRLIVLTVFHDPSCLCDECRRETGRDR